MRLVDTRHGMMLANPNDAYVGRSLIEYGEFSEGESEIFRKLLDGTGTVCEVGANIGAHTVALSRMCERVFAIEPQRLVYQTMCANLALNDVKNCYPILAAAGSSQGSIVVPQLDPDAPANFGGLALGAHKDGDTVPVVKLDDLALGNLKLIKIDVEGMELDVLKGATRKIGTYKPALYVENDREEKSVKLLAYLMGELSYECWWHFPPLYRLANYRKNYRNVFPSIVSVNVLALPQERVHVGDELLGKYRVRHAREKWKDAMDRVDQPLSTRGPIEERMNAL